MPELKVIISKKEKEDFKAKHGIEGDISPTDIVEAQIREKIQESVFFPSELAEIKRGIRALAGVPSDLKKLLKEEAEENQAFDLLEVLGDDFAVKAKPFAVFDFEEEKPQFRFERGGATKAITAAVNYIELVTSGAFLIDCLTWLAGHRGDAPVEFVDSPKRRDIGYALVDSYEKLRKAALKGSEERAMEIIKYFQDNYMALPPAETLTARFPEGSKVGDLVMLETFQGVTSPAEIEILYPPVFKYTKNNGERFYNHDKQPGQYLDPRLHTKVEILKRKAKDLKAIEAEMNAKKDKKSASKEEE